MASEITCIGVGNAYRSDDGLGLEVVRRLKRAQLVGTSVIEQSGEGLALVDILARKNNVYIFDAVSSRTKKPGTIYRLEAHRETIPRHFFNYSTHDFSVAEAIEVARQLNQLPQRLIIYGVEGCNFEPGVSLSPEILPAVNEVVQRVIEEIKALSGTLR